MPLGREEIGELRAGRAARLGEVEPSIFGTLLEQALDPRRARRLGAHYTPRAYVERLVVATVIEPLRAGLAQVQATARNQARAPATQGRAKPVQRLSRQAVRDARARPRLRHRQFSLRLA